MRFVNALGDCHSDNALNRRYGITRIGDVTGLDTIGVPVWFACRPNSRTLSVSQGKGVTDQQARTSAVMESVEACVAERPRPWVEQMASIDEMRGKGHSLVPFRQISRCVSDKICNKLTRAWAKGYRLSDNSAVYAPFELVGLDYRPDANWDRAAFSMTSQGLAAHKDHASALLHAMYELVEHDVTARVELFGVNSRTVSTIDVDLEGSVQLQQICEKLAVAGIVPQFFRLKGNIAPVCGASITRPFNGTIGGKNGSAIGFAARANEMDALVAALLEAIQSRLTAIAGARDDLTSEDYDLTGATRTTKKTLGECPTEIRNFDIGVEGGTQTQIDTIFNRLKADEIEDVFVFSLTSPNDPVQVVRVLAPNLTSLSGTTNTIPASALTRILRA